MEIHCPSCKEKYRIDETRIPDKGAYARCKKCQTRFLVQKPAVPPPSESSEADTNLNPDGEKWIQDYIAKDDSETAAKLLLDRITKFAKEKEFTKAESLRDQLNHAIPMALSEIVKANEVIEQEMADSMDQAHLEIWTNFYDPLNQSETVTFYHALKRCALDPGQSLFGQGEINLNLYFVEEGVLNLAFNHPQKGEPVVLTTLEAGSVSNTASFFLSTVCTFSLKAETASRLKYLGKDALGKWEQVFQKLVSELNRFCTAKEDISKLIETSGQNRRAHDRLRVSSKAEVQDLDHLGKPIRKKLKVMLSDISAGGLCYESMITKREAANELLGNRLIAEIDYPDSQQAHKEIREGTIVAINIIPFSKSTIHVHFDKLLEL